MPDVTALAPVSWNAVPAATGSTSPLRWRDIALVVIYAATLLGIHLGNTRMLTYREVLIAQPAKEMLAGGSWVVPRFAHVPSTHQPPGAHWTVALAMAIARGNDESIVRLPSATAGVLTAVMLAILTARWFGRRLGVVAGLIQATLYYVLQLARLAECDMLLIMLTTAAMGTFALANVESPTGRARARWLPWIFYALLAGTYLVKGMPGPLPVALACVSYALLRREPHVNQFLLNPIGLIILGVMTLGWLAPAYMLYPTLLDDQIAYHLGSFKGELTGEKPPLFHLVSVLLITLPWTPLAALGIVRCIQQQGYRQQFWQLLACWTIPGLVTLCFTTFQDKHIAAPLMPPLTIFAALALIEYIQWRQQCPTWLHGLSALASLVGCGLGIWLVGEFQPRGANMITLLIGLLGFGLMMISLLEYLQRTKVELVAIFATAWALSAGALWFVLPSHDSYADQTRLARHVNEIVPSEETVYLVRLPENQVTWYVDKPMVRIDLLPQFATSIPEQADTIYVLAPWFASNEFARWGSVEVLASCQSMNRYFTEEERMTLMKISRDPTRTARRRGNTH